MNILFVTPYLPYPPISGGSLQTYLRLVHLRRRGHRVFLFSLVRSKRSRRAEELSGRIDGLQSVYLRPNRKKIKDIFRRSLLYEIYTFDNGFGGKLKEFAKGNAIDIAIFEGLGVAQYRDSISHIPAMLYEHNVEEELVGQLAGSLRASPQKIVKGAGDVIFTNLYLSLFGGREKALVRKLEQNALRRFTTCLCCSERDASLLQGNAGDGACAVVPWCVEDPRAYHEPRERDVYTLAFVGSMGWEPNRDAILWFVRKVFPVIKARKKNTVLSVAGSHMAEDILRLDNGRDVVVKGFVPDLSAFLLDADIFVAPIRLGSGVNVKVIEAMSYGLPVVTTPKGAEGLGVASGKELFIAKAPEEFQEYVGLLIDDINLRKSLGDRARAYVASNHSTGRVMELLEYHMNRAVRES